MRVIAKPHKGMPRTETGYKRGGRLVIITPQKFFLVRLLLPTQLWCRVLLLHPITLNDKYTHTHTHTHTHTSARTFRRTPMDDRSAHRCVLYLRITQHSQATNIHAIGGIRTRKSSIRAPTGLQFRQAGQKDRPFKYLNFVSNSNPRFQHPRYSMLPQTTVQNRVRALLMSQLNLLKCILSFNRSCK